MNIKNHEIAMWDAVLRKNVDLAGTFHVTSLWKKNDESWKLIFNMDSRIITN